MATRVSVAGPAVDRLNRRILDTEAISLVDDRSGRVVAVCVDGLLPPSMHDLDLVRAISAAVGRCVVVPVAADGDTVGTDRWRREIPEQIPVVADHDPALPGELLRVAEAAADPVSPTPADSRRALLARSLSEERAYRAHRADLDRRRWLASRGDAVVDALSSVAPRPARMTTDDLDRASTDAAGKLAVDLDLEGDLHCPEPEPAPGAGDVTDLAVGVLTFGAAFGIGRLVEGPLRSAGLPDPVPAVLSVLFGAVLTTVVLLTRRRQRSAARRTRWAAAHVARLRRAWERELGEQDPSGSLPWSAAGGPPGWREEFLATESGIAEGKSQGIEQGAGR